MRVCDGLQTCPECMKTCFDLMCAGDVAPAAPAGKIMDGWMCLLIFP